MKLKRWLKERGAAKLRMHPADIKKTIMMYYNKVEKPTQRKFDEYVGGDLPNKIERMDRDELEELLTYMERQVRSSVLL